MFDSMIPKVNLNKMISSSKIDTGAPSPFRLNATKNVDETSPSFSDVMGSMVKSLDAEAKQPDKLMMESMVNPNIDIHDVILSVNKAEMTLSIASQVTTKIVQGYEKIISMQV